MVCFYACASDRHDLSRLPRRDPCRDQDRCDIKNYDSQNDPRRTDNRYASPHSFRSLNDIRLKDPAAENGQRNFGADQPHEKPQRNADAPKDKTLRIEREEEPDLFALANAFRRGDSSFLFRNASLNTIRNCRISRKRTRAPYANTKASGFICRTPYKLVANLFQVSLAQNHFPTCSLLYTPLPISIAAAAIII